MDSIQHFSQPMASGKILCLMPLTRVLVEEFIVDPISGYVICPPNSVDLSQFRVVWDPASMWPDKEKDLGWFKAASTQVSQEEFRREALVVFTVDFIDWDSFLDGNHDYHIEVLRRSAEQSEYLMDLVRLDFCRMDLPETLPGRVSMLSDKTYSCGLFYRLLDHESYLIAGQVMQVAQIAGIGLDCNNIGQLREVGVGETGNVARRGLTLFTQALEANYLSSKFIQCIVALEFLASPNEYERMTKAKSKIGAHIARDKAGYHEFCEKIECFQKEIRTKIIHGGTAFEELVPDRGEQKRIFRFLQSLIGTTLDDLIERSDLTWDDLTAYRNNRLRELGVK